MDHPEGAGSERADRVDFDRRVRLEFRGGLHLARSQASDGEPRKAAYGPD